MYEDLVTDAHGYCDEPFPEPAGRALHLLRPMLLDMAVQAAQRAENLQVVFVVGTNFHAIGFRHDQRDFQDIDRIEPQSFSVKRRSGIDFCGGDIEIERVHDQLRERELLIARYTCARYFLCRCFAHASSLYTD